MNILLTGCAGFIGFHLCKKLLKKGHIIIGVDNLNNYYSRKLKQDRLQILKSHKKFKFKKVDISNFKSLEVIFKNIKIDQVINLAAYAGVKYSLVNPKIYLKTNEFGFFNLLELSKNYKVSKIILHLHHQYTEIISYHLKKHNLLIHLFHFMEQQKKITKF